MKKNVLLLLLILLSSSSLHAQNQMDRNRMAKESYDRAEKKLDLAYNAILKKYKSHPKFIKNFKVAHRLWEEFKLAEVSVKFPEIDYGDPYEKYGSAFPQCYYGFLRELVMDRTSTLHGYLAGKRDDDPCSGSQI